MVQRTRRRTRPEEREAVVRSQHEHAEVVHGGSRRVARCHRGEIEHGEPFHGARRPRALDVEAHPRPGLLRKGRGCPEGPAQPTLYVLVRAQRCRHEPLVGRDPERGPRVAGHRTAGFGQIEPERGGGRACEGIVRASAHRERGEREPVIRRDRDAVEPIGRSRPGGRRDKRHSFNLVPSGSTKCGLTTSTSTASPSSGFTARTRSPMRSAPRSRKASAMGCPRLGEWQAEVT